MAVIDLLASDWSPGGQCGYIVPGVPWYNAPSLPGQTGYIVPGHPGTMRGVLVLIAPTVQVHLVSLFRISNFLVIGRKSYQNINLLHSSAQNVLFFALFTIHFSNLKHRQMTESTLNYFGGFFKLVPKIWI